MATEALQIDALWSGLNDPDTGKSYGGAIVATFAADGSTPKAIWENKEKTAPTTAGKSQFNLDANGQAEVFGDGVYVIKIYAPTDTGLTSPLMTFDGLTYLNPGGLLVSGIDSVVDLRAGTGGESDGEVAELLGYNTQGDGGGQQIYWDASSTDTDNGFSIFKVTSVATGRWLSVDINKLNTTHSGAVGDGITNDSTSINTAISVFGTTGGTLYIPEGTYDFNSNTLDLVSNITIKGSGSGVTILDNISTATVSDLSNVTFEGITFDNAGQLFILTSCDNFKFINCEFICIGVGGNRAIQTFNCTDFLITGCRFQDFQYGVWLKNGSDGNNFRFTFSDCTFESFITQSFPSGINIAEGWDVNITNCTFKDILASNSGYGIYQGDNTDHEARYINISNCRMNNIDYAIRIHNASDVVINNINGDSITANSILIDGDTDPITSEAQEGIAISNCRLSGDIRIGSDVNTGTQRVAITGNVINGSGWGIFISGQIAGIVKYVSVTGNTITDCQESGIAVTYSENVTITGNTIIDCNTDDDASGTSNQIAGIVFTTSNHTLTTSNTIVNTSGGLGHMKYGISYASNIASFPNHVFYNNIIQGMETSEYRGSYIVAPTTGTWTQGTDIEFPTRGVGNAPKTRCTESGTFSTATDSTGDTDGSTAVITGLTDTSDFNLRDWITASAGFSSTGPFLILELTSTTMTLNVLSNSAQANITVATIDPVFNDYVDLAP